MFHRQIFLIYLDWRLEVIVRSLTAYKMSARRHSDSIIVKVTYVISNNILYYFIDKTFETNLVGTSIDNFKLPY